MACNGAFSNPSSSAFRRLRRAHLPRRPAQRQPAANIRVEQFFMQPGSLLHSESAQQDYISSNYSHAARDINAKGLNLVAQLVAATPARSPEPGLQPDITLDLLPMIAKRRAAGETILLLGQVHTNCPTCPAMPSWPSMPSTC
jgi:acyl-CoA hydrolase